MLHCHLQHSFLKEWKIDDKQFELQFAIYRNSIETKLPNCVKDIAIDFLVYKQVNLPETQTTPLKFIHHYKYRWEKHFRRPGVIDIWKPQSWMSERFSTVLKNVLVPLKHGGV